MHPEIREFLKETYNQDPFTENGMSLVYYVTGKQGGHIVVAITYLAFKVLNSKGVKMDFENENIKDDDWLYPCNGEIQTEASMLRMLKLKAFW